jgi:hypothetical protein
MDLLGAAIMVAVGLSLLWVGQALLAWLGEPPASRRSGPLGGLCPQDPVHPLARPSDPGDLGAR